MKLIPSDRSMPAHLVLEVDLHGPVVLREDHQVARALEAVEAPQLGAQHLGIVIGGVLVHHLIVLAKGEWAFETSDITNSAELHPLLVGLRDR